MKKSFSIIISAVVAALIFVSCKPTEKNYKAAYDAAKAKREAAAAEQMRPATGLLSDDGPQLRIVDGDSIFVLRERLRLPDGSRLPGKWAVAIGLYKMDTNAKASADVIREKGFNMAGIAKASQGRFFTIVSTRESLDSVRNDAKQFRKAFPEYPFIGLPGAPVMINY